MEQQVISTLMNPANGITQIVGNRIYPIKLDNANVYPAIAFVIEVEERERGAKCVMYGGELTLIVEAKNRTELLELRSLIIQAFDGVDYFRFKRYSDDFETTSKTYYSEIFINIIKLEV